MTDRAKQIADRAAARRSRIVTHRSQSFDEAEKWDLQFWQSRSPSERLSALVAIREDVEKVEKARADYERRS